MLLKISKASLRKHLVAILMVKLLAIIALKWLFFTAPPEGRAPDWFATRSVNNLLVNEKD